MSRLTRSLSAESRKVTATKMWWIMAIVLALYSAMMAGLFAAMFGVLIGETGEAGDMAAQGMPAGGQFSGMVYSSVATFGYVIPLLFGAIMATGELRHRTLGLAFVAEPKRGIVLAAKVTVLLVVGAVIGAVGLVGAVGVGGPILSFVGADTGLGSVETWALISRVVLAIAIWAVIGFGLGLLVRNQAVTIVIALVFTQFLEPTLRMAAMFWEWSANIAKFLPGAASDSFVGASVLNDLMVLESDAPGSMGVLNIWQGLLVLLAYAVLTVVVGWQLRWRKDVVV